MLEAAEAGEGTLAALRADAEDKRKREQVGDTSFFYSIFFCLLYDIQRLEIRDIYSVFSELLVKKVHS